MGNIFFKEITKKKGLKTPTDRLFDIDKWHEVWTRVEGLATEQDKMIYNAGIIIDELLTEIRSNLKFMYENEIPKVSYKELLMAYISLTNRDRSVISNSMTELSGVHADVHSITMNNNMMGNDITIQEMSDAAVDGMESAIKTSLMNKNKKITSSENPIDIVDFIIKESSLSQLYSIYSGYWNAFLWNGYELTELDKKNKIFSFKQPKCKYEIGFMASQIRKSKLVAHSFSIIGNPNVINKFDDDKYIIIEKRGRIKSVKVSSISNAPEQVRYTNADWRVQTLDLEDNLPKELLNQEFENGFTIFEVLDVFRCLILLSSYYHDKYPKKDGFDNLKKLLEFCPKIQKSKLSLALQNATGYPIEKIKIILQFIEFKGARGEDLWCHPIVSISESEYALITSALLTPVMIRVVEHWFVKLNITLQGKGKTYEKNIIHPLNHNILLNCYIDDYDKAISGDVKSDSGVEDIDLLVRVGETILIGEAKSIVTTDSPISQYRTINILKHAAKQAKRKAKFVEDNIESVFKNLGWFFDKSKKYTFTKCILNSGRMYVGSEIDDVPVCDEKIINKYFEENIIPLISSYNDKNKVEHLAWFKLYDDFHELQTNLNTYLCNPPQISERNFIYNDQKLPCLSNASYKIITKRLIPDDLRAQDLLNAKYVFPLETVDDVDEKIKMFDLSV
ncbi:hypothetical protein FR932_06910 [Moritella marina ATCC 15381]|uniref:NERD domain-containing protein n=1 Tax=Moritella marina ATCC 15381 TaxID=1202962 RepID=A0A5J6WHJ6_MORMI|nr:hypothetical protein [Moritella marina]QFI37589.1 hypothetical protein FR932_06910 [Moritella marina ATCC 15381]